MKQYVTKKKKNETVCNKKKNKKNAYVENGENEYLQLTNDSNN